MEIAAARRHEVAAAGEEMGVEEQPLTQGGGSGIGE